MTTSSANTQLQAEGSGKPVQEHRAFNRIELCRSAPPARSMHWRSFGLSTANYPTADRFLLKQQKESYYSPTLPRRIIADSSRISARPCARPSATEVLCP